MLFRSARAVIEGGAPTLDEARIGAMVAVRMKRQAEIMHRDPPVRLSVILGEQVLSIRVGGAAVMRGQLAHLAAVAQRPNVDIRVLRIGGPAHPGMKGSFRILSYPEPDNPPIVYVDTPIGGRWEQRPADVLRLQEDFAVLSSMALAPHDSIDRMTGYADRKSVV